LSRSLTGESLNAYLTKVAKGIPCPVAHLVEVNDGPGDDEAL
jgi:hypothetical protein